MLQNGACRPRPIVGFTARNNDIYIYHTYIWSSVPSPPVVWWGCVPILVGGLEHFFIFHIIWEFHHPD